MKQEDELRVPAAMAMAIAHRRRLLLGDPFSVDGRGSSEEIFHADGHRHRLRDGLFNGYGDVDRDGNGSSYEIFNGDADRNRSRNEIFTGDGDRNRSRNDIFNGDEGGKGNRRRYEIFNGDGDGDRDGCGNGNGSSKNEIFNGNGDGIGNGNGSSNEIFNRNGIGDRSKDEIFDAIGNGNRNRNEILNGNRNGDGDRRNEIFNGNGIGNGDRNESSNDIFNGNGNRNGILDGNGDGTGNRSKNKNGNGHGNGSGSVECPRCESKNTKFCYYNNYNLCQPRHFCKACKRYWTKGGTLRNVPVGGGCRKNNYPSKNARNTEKSSPANLPQPPPRFLDLLTLPDHTLLTHCHSLNGPPRPADSVESSYLLPSSDTFPKQEVLDSTLGTTRDECRAASDGNETIGAYNTTMFDIGKSTKPISSPLQWSMQQHQRVPLPLMTMTNDMQHQRFPLPLMTATDDGGPPLMENNNIPTPSYTNNCHLPFKRSVLMMMQDGNMRDDEQEKKKKVMPPPPDESVTFLDWQVLPPAAVASSSSSQGFFEDPWNDLSHYGYGQGPFT